MTKHLLVQGYVQGVGFRYNTKLLAEQLSIKGSVKNLMNGDVEIYCMGEMANLNLFIEKIRNGFTYAKVKRVISRDCIRNDFIDFKVIY